jgi:hypothetical protein
MAGQQEFDHNQRAGVTARAAPWTRAGEHAKEFTAGKGLGQQIRGRPRQKPTA